MDWNAVNKFLCNNVFHQLEGRDVDGDRNMMLLATMLTTTIYDSADKAVWIQSNICIYLLLCTNKCNHKNLYKVLIILINKFN